MSQPINNDLRTMIRDLAKKRDSVDRRQLYYALIKAEVWTPVQSAYVAGQLQPADLHPLDREALGGLASFAVFTHDKAAEVWQKEEGEGVPLRLERIDFVDLLPHLLNAGAGSAYLNPASKYSGELYRHELETMLEGVRTLRRRARQAKRQAAAPKPETPVEAPTVWQRLTEWLK